MSLLPDILSSRGRAEIFRLLFGVSSQEVHLRELQRRSGLALRTIQQEVEKLLGMELLVARRDGNRVYYSANTAHPLYQDIRSMVLKTSGLVEVLREALSGERVDAAFVFGSVARGEEGAEGDVDLMIVADAGLSDVSRWLSGVPEKLGREVNPHVMSADELRRRREAGDQFVSRVLSSPKLFAVGDEDELERMG
jgi:predicted nucleotidyltransferase